MKVHVVDMQESKVVYTCDVKFLAGMHDEDKAVVVCADIFSKDITVLAADASDPKTTIENIIAQVLNWRKK